MGKRVVKYNPAFLSEDELVASFVVRQIDLELIMRAIRENVTQANQHVLVIGPRGSGKTMLVRRAMVEVRRTPELNERWYPIVFAEETYESNSLGEFWLQAIFHLCHQTDDDRWRRTYEELSEEKSDKSLQDRAMSQLMDFAGAQKKRLLLVVENLNMLLGDQFSGDDAWGLRHTLLNEPRIMLLATATSRFEEIDHSGKAMFELFKCHELRPLDAAECGAVWTHINGQELPDKRIRPIQILTGGNPRLVTIISQFGAGLSFKTLLDDLTQLVDDHTEYFKSHLDGLAATERKVYLALAEIWDPATARQVCQAARLDVSKTSSLLNRLVGRGAVTVADDSGRTKWYQVAERLYNIYYLMRRHGGPSGRVQAVVNFMKGFYSGPRELVRLAERIAEEANELPSELRADHARAFKAIVSSDAVRPLLDEIAASGSRVFPEEMAGVPGAKPSSDARVTDLLSRARELSKEPQRQAESEGLYREAILLAPQDARVWAWWGLYLHDRLQRYDEAERAYRRAIELEPKMAWGWALLGVLLDRDLQRYNEAEQAYRKAIELEPERASSWGILGRLLHERLERYDEAEQAYRTAIELRPDQSWPWSQLANLLCGPLRRTEEALRVTETCLERHPGDARVANEFAWALFRSGSTAVLDRAEVWARQAVQTEPTNPYYQHTLASILIAGDKVAEALESATRCVGDAESVGHFPDDAIDLFVRIGASGYAREAMEVVVNSPSAPLLEPLIVGLKLFLGEDVKAAAEILEVGKDVAKRVEEYRVRFSSVASGGHKSD